eukprot:TRINITY_DN23876_c0_g1_i1.p1 TRINITY_DN23876_c0_g1~~TRINITY_DN23876_c0_g1_i1.p1  ORF type:complete len:908 (-),score=138.34 TRINITY_DN23876_c0_g1_i1:266-2914(-)
MGRSSGLPSREALTEIAQRRSNRTDVYCDPKDHVPRVGFKLHSACYYLNVPEIQQQLRSQADVNVRGHQGKTPLMTVLTSALEAVPDPLRPMREKAIRCAVTLLLDAGADAGLVDLKGHNFLHVAAFMNFSEDLIAFLCGAAPACMQRYDNTGWLPIHLAMSKGFGETVNVMLSCGIEVNTPSKPPMTSAEGVPLWQCRSENAGQSPTHILCQFGWIGLLSALICGHRLSVSPPIGRWGETPLHLCAMHGRPKCASTLLRNHKFLRDMVQAKNFDGHTASDLAREHENLDVELVLATYGLCCGDRVRLIGLKGKACYNDRVGCLKSGYDPEKGRFQVCLDAGVSDEASKYLVVKPANLVLLPGLPLDAITPTDRDGKPCSKVITGFDMGESTKAELEEIAQSMGLSVDPKWNASTLEKKIFNAEQMTQRADLKWKASVKASRQIEKQRFQQLAGQVQGAMDNFQNRCLNPKGCEEMLKSKSPFLLYDDADFPAESIAGDPGLRCDKQRAEERMVAALVQHGQAAALRTKAACNYDQIVSRLRNSIRQLCRHCAMCGSRDQSLSACSKCKMVWYCCSSEQKQDWRIRHKFTCRALQQVRFDDEVYDKWNWMLTYIQPAPWELPVSDVPDWESFFQMRPPSPEFKQPGASCAYEVGDSVASNKAWASGFCRLISEELSYASTIGCALLQFGVDLSQSETIIDVVGGTNKSEKHFPEFRVTSIAACLAGQFPSHQKMLLRFVAPNIAPRECSRIEQAHGYPVFVCCHAEDYASFRRREDCDEPSLVVIFHPGPNESPRQALQYTAILSDCLRRRECLCLTEFDDDDLEALWEFMKMNCAPRLSSPPQVVARGCNPWRSLRLVQDFHNVNKVYQDNGTWLLLRGQG